MPEIAEKTLCYHCGDLCNGETIVSEGRSFCCTGCKLVYEILSENNLCTYYDLNRNPGIKQGSLTGKRFSFLDEPEFFQKLISFQNGEEVRVSFHIPSMHCSSCIWLLENFKRVDNGVSQSNVNFLKKEIHLTFNNRKTSLRKIVEALTQLGYEPSLNLDSIGKKEKKRANRSRIIRIGVAGFCFGNIMMLYFPEYFSSGQVIDHELKLFFSYMTLLLSLPVFFYSASEFFIKSYQAIKHGSTSIDIPIALGIAAIFLRSAFEILSRTGAGFLDSGSGLVFFMLIGRWFQDFTFDSMAFDRDYKSYFPISVTTIKNGIEKDVFVNDLKIKDRIIIRNNEIIPVDAMLLKGNARLDYHFVTGESMPVTVHAGETVFAGAKQTGSLIELQVTKEISQSNLTQLWNRNYEGRESSGFDKLVQSISRWFIYVVLFIASVSAAYWWSIDIHIAMRAFTAVLVIACPCALALSAPFTYGNILRILGRNKIYLRNYQALEKLADINVVVFDKTGTLTENNSTSVGYEGNLLSTEERKLVFSLARQSLHPLSKLVSRTLSSDDFYPVTDFRETTGKGISALVNGYFVRLGTADFTGSPAADDSIFLTRVFVSIDRKNAGHFIFGNWYRKGTDELAKSLQRKKYQLAVLTGDNESEKSNLRKIFPGDAEIRFNQSPSDKLSFIKCLHEKKLKVMMVGDGLNDAGALLQSDVGISITDNTNSFTPASDGIADASQLEKLQKLLAYSKSAVRIIIISFIISLLYNFIGLSFAVTGKLSPLIAAILMPISTISLVLFTVISSTIKGKLLGFK